MGKQCVVPGQVFRLGERIENRLQERRLPTESFPDESQTLQLAGEMRRVRLEQRQLFPIIRA